LGLTRVELRALAAKSGRSSAPICSRSRSASFQAHAPINLRRNNRMPTRTRFWPRFRSPDHADLHWAD